MREYNMYRDKAEVYRKIRDEKAGSGDAPGYNRYDRLYNHFSDVADDVDQEPVQLRKG